MLNTYITTKKAMTQAWDKAGVRHAVTILSAPPILVTAVKTAGQHGYEAIQVGLGSQTAKRLRQPQVKAYQQQKLPHLPKATREIKTPSGDYAVGSALTQPFAIGDIVKVKGTTIGRGFAGVVKRWGFAGGPKTHGQSDRHRAPGSIGQGTSPGRVHRGKRMGGHMGANTKTVRNLVIVNLDETNQEIWLSGPVPGHRNSQVIITKIGHTDKFPGLVSSTEGQAEAIVSAKPESLPQPAEEPVKPEPTAESKPL
jgi:large subunit ribosomal protein L3